MTDTKTRILIESLTLFNRHGERNVTTNHIAEAIGISPGNLYYHFRNKADIVFELFRQYRTQVAGFMAVPTDRPLTWQDKMNYLAAILQNMWQARFLHRDMAHLLNQDDRLRAEYVPFVRDTLKQGVQIYQGLRDAGLLEASDEQLRALLVNTWVLAASWVGFVHSLVPESATDDQLGHRLVRQGIYQIICLEAPYLRGEAAAHLPTMKASYQENDLDTLDLLFGSEAAEQTPLAMP